MRFSSEAPQTAGLLLAGRREVAQHAASEHRNRCAYKSVSREFEIVEIRLTAPKCRIWGHSKELAELRRCGPTAPTP